MMDLEPGCVCDFEARDLLAGSLIRKDLGAEQRLSRSVAGERGSRLELFKICQEGRVDSVNTFGLGLGRTSAGLGRIAYVFGSSQCLQGLECGSSPTSGTADPLVRGVFALT